MTATISDSSPDIPSAYRVWVATAFLLGAMARDTFGDPNAAGRALLDDTADAPSLEVLTHGETRVLQYLPTNLSAREIADDLYLSVNTVKTHQRHLYQKLGACSRTQAVEKARALGLLAPSAPRPNRGHARARHRPVARGAVPGRAADLTAPGGAGSGATAPTRPEAVFTAATSFAPENITGAASVVAAA